MRRKAAEIDDGPKKQTLYTIKLDSAKLDRVRDICDGRMWEPYDVAYARFAFKGPKVNIVGYESGKLVVQGKETEDFILNTLEPEVTGEAVFGYDEVLHPDWYEAHAGLDESGKGDFFGPVVSACVIAGPDEIREWTKAGIRDSKTITDRKILDLDRLIRDTRKAVVKTVFCGMHRYNDLMGKPRANLNKLLAWQHAKALEQALGARKVPWGMLDQFSRKDLVSGYFSTPEFELRMRTKAEDDPVVAAASVVARAEFVRQMGRLSVQLGEKLVKGAGPKVVEQAASIVEKLGAPALRDFGKLHFRTAYEVVSAAGKLDDLPLPKPKERVPFRR
ncbi:MAG: ribonuclease HIII [Verrucomicrobia bacterium]|nr:MAG: ribonuclease HIII [Verrucomicrobiota bacterium]